MSLCWPSFYTVNSFELFLPSCKVCKCTALLCWFSCLLDRQKVQFLTAPLENSVAENFPPETLSAVQILLLQTPSIPDLRPAFQAGSHERQPIQPAVVLLLRHSSQQSHSDLSAPHSDWILSEPVEWMKLISDWISGHCCLSSAVLFLLWLIYSPFVRESQLFDSFIWVSLQSRGWYFAIDVRSIGSLNDHVPLIARLSDYLKRGDQTLEFNWEWETVIEFCKLSYWIGSLRTEKWKLIFLILSTSVYDTHDHTWLSVQSVFKALAFS